MRGFYLAETDAAKACRRWRAGVVVRKARSSHGSPSVPRRRESSDFRAKGHTGRAAGYVMLGLLKINRSTQRRKGAKVEKERKRARCGFFMWLTLLRRKIVN